MKKILIVQGGERLHWMQCLPVWKTLHPERQFQ